MKLTPEQEAVVAEIAWGEHTTADEAERIKDAIRAALADPLLATRPQDEPPALAQDDGALVERLGWHADALEHADASAYSAKITDIRKAADAIERLARERDKWQNDFLEQNGDLAECSAMLKFADGKLAEAQSKLAAAEQDLGMAQLSKSQMWERLHSCEAALEAAHSKLAAARNDALEDAAKVCDDLKTHNDIKESEAHGMDMDDSATYHRGAWTELKKCAAAIRALKTAEPKGE